MLASQNRTPVSTPAPETPQFIISKSTKRIDCLMRKGNLRPSASVVCSMAFSLYYWCQEQWRDRSCSPETLLPNSPRPIMMQEGDVTAQVSFTFPSGLVKFFFFPPSLTHVSSLLNIKDLGWIFGLILMYTPIKDWLKRVAEESLPILGASFQADIELNAHLFYIRNTSHMKPLLKLNFWSGCIKVRFHH